MQNITIFDYLLLPVYLYIFYLIIRKRSVKYTDAELRKYFLIAFFLRMFGSVAYSMLVQYYYGYGDSFIYYYGSNYLRDQILQDGSNIKYLFAKAAEVKTWYNVEVNNINYAGYFGIESNLFVMKISAVLSFLSFNSFLIISLFFGLFSFAGQWRMFLVFNDINKGKQLKLLAWAVLLTPSIWFWGSGLMKDSVCIGGLGFIIHYLYKIFITKNRSVKDIIILLILLYVVGSIKSYIIIILGISIATMAFTRFITAIKNIVIKAFVIVVFLFATVIVAFITNFSDQVQSFTEESIMQFDNFQHNYEVLQNTEENSEGGLKSVTIDNSLQGLLLQTPLAAFTCLFRPFIWESGKLIIVFTSLESLLLLLATVFVFFKVGILRFFRVIFNDPYILTAFTMSMLFAVLIGLTTYNFGTMARYKIILLPFFYFMLVNLYLQTTDDYKKDSEGVVNSA
ncbi:MAG: hypothetical protein WBP16_13610 [Ferruginibacter sp.]